MEMMVVLVLVGILSGLASVLWTRFSWRVHVLGAVDELRNAIQLARSDAMTKRRNSGILIDTDSLRYLRFIDSSSTGVSDGVYTGGLGGDSIIQNWTRLPKTMVIHSVASTISPAQTVHPCDQPASAVSSTVQSRAYSVVFRPDGSSWAGLDAQVGVQSFPDRFRLLVISATGWVALEK